MSDGMEVINLNEYYMTAHEMADRIRDISSR